MRTRYTINDAGELESRDGVVLGRLTSITLETSPAPLPTPLSPPPTGEEKDTPIVPTPLTLLPSPVDEVWATYVAVIKPRNTGLDTAGRRTIEQALRVATKAACQRAIHGCAASDWHMGRDPQTNGKSYKQLSQILKGKRGGRSTREQIDFFIDIADAQGIASEGFEAVDKIKLSRAKLAVITAWEFPKDDHAANAGDLARSWLRDRGIEVVMSGADERPKFQSVRA